MRPPSSMRARAPPARSDDRNPTAGSMSTVRGGPCRRERAQRARRSWRTGAVETLDAGELPEPPEFLRRPDSSVYSWTRGLLRVPTRPPAGASVPRKDARVCTKLSESERDFAPRSCSVASIGAEGLHGPAALESREVASLRLDDGFRTKELLARPALTTALGTGHRPQEGHDPTRGSPRSPSRTRLPKSARFVPSSSSSQNNGATTARPRHSDPGEERKRSPIVCKPTL